MQPTCGKGHYYVNSKTAERTCPSCPTDTFQDAADHRETGCKDQPYIDCNEGQYYADFKTAERTCSPCPEFTFQPSSSHRDTTCISAQEAAGAAGCTGTDAVEGPGVVGDTSGNGIDTEDESQTSSICTTLLAAVAAEQAAADAAQAAADAALLKANEMAALKHLGYVGGGITVLVITNFALSPGQRDYELYLIVLGGLLDATTDGLYLYFETFVSDALKFAAIVILTLPIIIVLLAFWAIVQRSYAKQRWRVVFLPIEGALSLMNALVGASYYWAKQTAASIFGLFYKAWPILKSVQDRITGDAGWTHAIWHNIETKVSQERVANADGTENVRDMQRELKFFHGGLTQLLFAFILFPIILLVVEAVLLVCVLVLSISFLAVAAVSVLVAIVTASFIAVFIPASFSVMAFLRLFVLLPSLWRQLATFAVWFAKQAKHGSIVPTFDDARETKLRPHLFGIHEDTTVAAANTTDLKKASIKYLLIEFVFESLPQIIVQVTNNSRRDNWSPIGISSMAISVYAVVSTMYKYGYLYLCAPKVTLKVYLPTAGAVGDGGLRETGDGQQTVVSNAVWEPVDMDPNSKNFRIKSVHRQNPLRVAMNETNF